MRAFVTGGGGFIGSSLVPRLLAGGHDVVALARSPASAQRLADAGCTVVEGDLAEERTLIAALSGCDAAFHVAGDYRVGIGRAGRAAMHEVNVRGTERLIDAAVAAGVPRILHVSTINAFGDTGYRIVDESYARPRPYRYVSAYDETKHLAHLVAEERIAAGAPVVVAMPGGVYGPGDPSQLGGVLRQAAVGSLAADTFGDLGMNMVHVDDVASGLLLVAERGALGESYVLGGEITTLAELVRRVAALAGRRPPGFHTPTWALRAAAPIVDRFGQNLRELIRASAGVTYWATDAKARRELGYAPRDLRDGLPTIVG
jgi:nucleoside-diphosphate-sugar epimerase